MSGTFRELRFHVIVEDVDRWTHQQAVDAGRCCGIGDDHAVHMLDEAMREAGNRFIAEHPEMFSSGELS